MDKNFIENNNVVYYNSEEDLIVTHEIVSEEEVTELGKQLENDEEVYVSTLNYVD